MSILITGGTGFFGRAILRMWKEKSKRIDDVFVLTRSPESFLNEYPEFDGLPWLKFHCGDICIRSTLPNHIEFSGVIHAAADATLGPQLTSRDCYKQIVDGTQNILDLAVNCNSKKLLYISSGAVYGVQPESLEKTPENWETVDSVTTYGAAKIAAENLCGQYRTLYGLHTVIARCFSFVGQDMTFGAHFAIGNFIRDALNRDCILVNSDGSSIRSYLEQDDLVHWLLTIFENGQSGQVYNVGSDQAISIKDLAYLVRDILSPNKDVHILGGNGRTRYIPDINKARNELALDVTLDVEKAIKKVARVVMERYPH